MIQIIYYTPVYVWPLFAYLLWIGWRARRSYVASWKTLLIMPTILFVWSIYRAFSHFEVVSISLWAVSITIGIVLGALTTRRLDLRFDKRRRVVEIAGNWTPLLLSLSIFSLRYFLGATYVLHPELAGSAILMGVECIATVISGTFTGRLIGYWQRAKESPHCDLAEANG
ncbi:MAG: hypothetical protein K1060chlam2_01029 [Chlamydiae bacterium]|nr:hypothetical protein [Chlamydiota bacterium]